MYFNDGVKCDVNKCIHNENGCKCKLNSIKVTCSCGSNCTCCDDYTEKE